MNAPERVLTIFLRLLNGEKLVKKNLIDEYGKQDRSIQRDISIIEEVLKKYDDEFGILNREEKGIYYLEKEINKKEFTDTEILIILKIFLSTRIFNDEEMLLITNKILDMTENQENIKKMIKNEEFYYCGISKKNLIEDIAFISEAINKKQMIEFEYTRNNVKKVFLRVPKSIYFSDLYFFMITDSHTVQDDMDFDSLNKFRINNIMSMRAVSNRNKDVYKDRFEGGVLRSQTDLPFLGNPTTIILDFYYDPIYVLDRFPNSEIIKKNEDGSVRIKFLGNDGYGVKMWVLTQGDFVKVISPKNLKDYVIEQMTSTLKYYGIETEKKETL